MTNPRTNQFRTEQKKKIVFEDEELFAIIGSQQTPPGVPAELENAGQISMGAVRQP
jgi:hypothetical protein